MLCVGGWYNPLQYPAWFPVPPHLWGPPLVMSEAGLWAQQQNQASQAFALHPYPPHAYHFPMTQAPLHHYQAGSFGHSAQPSSQPTQLLLGSAPGPADLGAAATSEGPSPGAYLHCHAMLLSFCRLSEQPA